MGWKGFQYFKFVSLIEFFGVKSDMRRHWKRGRSYMRLFDADSELDSFLSIEN